MLIATQPGLLRIWTPEHGVLATAAMDLTSRTCANRDRGLLGVAVDPNFAVNHFIYVYYTYNKFDTCATASPSGPVNRVARFVLPDTNIVDVDTETVLVDNIASWGGDHNAGDLQFGKDGNLYVSVGDGGCDYAGGGCAGTNNASRDEFALLGKILRITPSGGIPPDNPFQGAGTARCSTEGRTQPGLRCQETYAWGLRNPFRIAFDPNATQTRFFINDVGQNVWEEIDEGLPGADYGWNVREGHCMNGSATDCGPPPAGMTNPIFDYGHGDGCASITGGAFVPNGIWPAMYDGAYLFGDYVCGRIFRLVPNGGGWDRVTFADQLGSSSAVHLAFGPRGAGKALYYTTYAGGGAVRRIFYSVVNDAPTAAFAAATEATATDVRVIFDASGSSDPDAGDTLTYIWDFGDGSGRVETGGPTISHTYATAGPYIVTLRVRDSHGAESPPVSKSVYAGNTPPVPTITSPEAGRRFAVGERIELRGSATDAEDGTLADASLSWTVIRHHGTHTHPYAGPVAGNAASITGPAPEDLHATASSSLEVALTVTDSRRESATVRQIVSPRLVNLRFATSPPGLTLVVDGTPFTAPRTWTSWEGWDVMAEAPDQPPHEFLSWSNGEARAHLVRTPAADVELTASFRPIAIDPPLTVPDGIGDAPPDPPASRPSCNATAPGRSARARIRYRRRGRTVVATMSRRLGASVDTGYNVTLTRRCAIVAHGRVRDRTLVLRLRPSGSRAVHRDGARIRVITYPQLSGSYRLRGARIAATTVTFVRPLSAPARG